MPSESVRAYKECLPKFSRVNFWELFTRIGTFASISGFGASVYYFNSKPPEYIYSSFLVTCLICSTIYLIYQEQKKLNRFAQATIFMHYISHISRDVLEQQKNTMNHKFDLKAISTKLLDPISTCFSILTAKSCRVCLKILVHNENKILVETFARDNVSAQVGKMRETPEVVHYLDDNTDFYNLWYWEKGCSRYFLANDLFSLFRNGKYKNSSFKLVGEPEVYCTYLGKKFFKGWKLPYKSTLVVPVRYIPDDAMHNETKRQITWGFLCIDCNSRNVFDPVYSPELAASFADTLYILFSQLELMCENFRTIDDATRP